jgi:hypothetical protein
MNKTTRYVLISLVAIVIIYDILALIFGGSTATVSYQVWLAGRKFMFLPYSLGVLMSHFFGPTYFSKKIPKLRYLIWIATSIITLILSICLYPNCIHPFASLLIGLGMGMFWDQEKIT